MLLRCAFRPAHQRENVERPKGPFSVDGIVVEVDGRKRVGRLVDEAAPNEHAATRRRGQGVRQMVETSGDAEYFGFMGFKVGLGGGKKVIVNLR